MENNEIVINDAKVLVWDWTVRCGHWLMAAAFIVAYLTAESETWRLVHVISGSLVLAVASYRIVWGVVGTRYARFTDFVSSPGRLMAYLRSLWQRRPEHYVGHNPAGGWAILLLLALGISAGISGWAVYNDVGGEWLEEGHEVLANILLGVVLVHISGVLVSSLLHRENLVRAMISGYKYGKPEDAIKSSRPLALIFLAVWLGLVVWLFIQ